MSDIEGLERLLRDHRFFRDMDPKACEVIAGCAANERFNAGDYLMRQGEAADKFYLIRHGAVAQELHVPDREPIIVQTLHEGDILGWSWLVPPYQWTMDSRAMQLTRVLSLDARCLRSKYENDPTLAYELFKRFVPVLADRLEAARLQLIDIYG
ncbi:MAG: cyclic nucleotide-binding domain-containing protein [Candidatus Competibacteraceae bacterium]|nr:cyclic nucleotide-binding domain-containing protein [Candidatus Competibacteraceae bacterium]